VRIKRVSNGSTVVRNYFKEGFEESGTTDYFYTRDHLGSVRELVAGDGATVASRVSYDPWGKVTEIGAGALTDFAFTGHHFDRSTGLSLTWWRPYDANLGRWLSKDPIDLKGGPNLYGYVDSSPVDSVDLYGVMTRHQCKGLVIAGGITCAVVCGAALRGAPPIMGGCMLVCLAVTVKELDDMCRKYPDPDDCPTE